MPSDTDQTPGNAIMLAYPVEELGLPGAPPPDRPLTIVPHGWLLRRSTSFRPWTLLPEGKQHVVKVLSALPPALPWLLAPWVLGWAGSAGRALYFLTAGSLLLWNSSERLVRTYLRRFARRQLALPTLRASPEGIQVRVRGIVRSDGSFSAALSGRPAVLARYRDDSRSWPRGDETRGVDFRLELEGGAETVKVHVREVFLADEPAGSFEYPLVASRLKPKAYGIVLALASMLMPLVGAGTSAGNGGAVGGVVGVLLGGLFRGKARCAESVIGPGDLVDVVGVIDREVDASGETASTRGAPLRAVLRAGPSLPLIIQRVRG